jgi:hypothetical protein
MTYGLNSNIKLFESLEDFDSYRNEFFDIGGSSIKDIIAAELWSSKVKEFLGNETRPPQRLLEETVYIGPCEDHNNSIYEIRFVSGRNLTCIIRK